MAKSRFTYISFLIRIIVIVIDGSLEDAFHKGDETLRSLAPETQSRKKIRNLISSTNKDYDIHLQDVPRELFKFHYNKDIQIVLI